MPALFNHKAPPSRPFSRRVLLAAPFSLPLVAADAGTRTLSSLKPFPVVRLENRTQHVQGIALDGGSLWASSVSTERREGYLHQFELASGRHLLTVPIHDGERFHAGGISLDGDSIWVPVAEYRKHSTSSVLSMSRRTYAVKKRFEVEDHIGCVALAGNRVLGGNWDSREIYSWSRKGELLQKQTNPNRVAYQDLKCRDGALVASGVLAGEVGAVDWLDPRTLALRKRIVCGKTDRGVCYTNEGMDVLGGRLYLLPEDGPSRLFTFAL